MKKGFTLVELLAVIVILGVISLITYGVITNNIKSTKRKSFEISAKNLLESAKEYVTKNMDNNDFPEDGIDVTSEALEIKNNPFQAGIVKRNTNGQIELVAVTDGNFCATGTKNEMIVTEGTCKAIDNTAPELKVKAIKVGPTSAQIMVRTQDSESGIESYEFCNGTDCKTYERDGKKTIIKDVIKLDNLKPNTEYKIKVTSKNGTKNEDIQTTKKELTIVTKEIEEPKFSISSKTYATNKVLTIKYPENDGSYVYEYKIGEETKVVEGTTVEIEIKNRIEVEAVIKRDSEIVISNSILIDGIDVEGPTVDVVIPDIDKWTKTKKITVNAKDKGVGLALRPYSFDKNEWQKEETIDYDTSLKLNVKSRDRLGNTNKKFTINGTTECCVDCDNLCVINNIDSVEPLIKITYEGTKTTKPGYTEWFNSDKVVATIDIEDHYLFNNENHVGGSGINYSTLSVKLNDNVVEITEISEGKYRFEISENRENKIIVSVEDNVGNVGTKEDTVKLDNVIPVIAAKKDPLTLDVTDYKFIDNLNVQYGPTGGVSVCDPENTKKTGVYSVTCRAFGNNEKESNNDVPFKFEVKHSYAARYVRKTCSYNYQCDCHEREWCDSKCCRTASNGCHNCCTGYCTDYSDCHTWTECSTCTGTYDCSIYDCPNGGTLNGKTCNY